MNCGNEMKIKKWSSQWTQFMQLCKEAWTKFRTSTGFEPVTSRFLVRCSTNWAMKPLTLGAGQLLSVHMFPWKKWVLMIYEINHIWTAEMKWKWRNDRRSECNLCNCVKKPEKKFRTSIGFEPVTSRLPVWCSPWKSWNFFRLLYAIA